MNSAVFRRESTPDDLCPPRSDVYTDEMVFCAMGRRSRNGGSRRDAQHRNGAGRAPDMVQRMAMVVPVQNQFRSVLFEKTGEIVGIAQAASEPRSDPDGWMVDHHHPVELAPRRFIEHLGQCFALLRTDFTGGHERQGRDSGIDADERDAVPFPEIGKRNRPHVAVAPHECREAALHRGKGASHVSVMIARHDTHPVWRTEFPCHRQGLRELGLEADIDEVAGQGDVIGLPGKDIGDDFREYRHVMDRRTGTVPVERPGHPLVHQVAEFQWRQRANVGIGQVSDQEGQGTGLASGAGSVSPVGPAASSLESARERNEPLHLRLFRRLIHIWFRVSRGMTLGVRAAVLDEEGRVFLVRHSYLPGWHLPGGGVEVGQTLEQALAIELREEGNIRLTGAATLMAIYNNAPHAPRDHVALFVVRDFRQEGPRLPDREIVECGFFPLGGLPEETTAGTRRRLDEIAGLRPVEAYW